eukprot:SAG31_NODE_2210_length_6179_cov_78.720230_1_plen_439_part_00
MESVLCRDRNANGGYGAGLRHSCVSCSMATNTASAFGPSERTVLATKHCVDGAICLLHGEYEMSAAALEASLSHRPGDASALSLLRLAHRCTSDAARLPVLGLLAQANAYVRLLGHSDIVVARDVCRSLPFEARAAAASAEGAARSQLHEFASAMPDVAASLVAAANQYVDRAYASCGQPDAIGLYAFASRLWSGGVSARRKPAQMHTATEELELARACYEAAMRIQPAAANAAARGLERVHDLCLRKGVASAAATGHPIPSPSGRSVDALAGTAAACEADLSGSHACGLRNDAASVTNTTKRLGWSDLLAEWEALDSVPGSAAGSRRRVRAIACELLAAPDGEGFARLLRADGWPVMIGKRCCFLVFCATIREMRDFNREKYGTNRESVTLQGIGLESQRISSMSSRLWYIWMAMMVATRASLCRVERRQNRFSARL